MLGDEPPAETDLMKLYFLHDGLQNQTLGYLLQAEEF